MTATARPAAHRRAAPTAAAPVRRRRPRPGPLWAATLLVAAAAGGGLPVAPRAAAAPCSDVEVIFARGSDEPPGVGKVGQPFVDALRSKLPGRTVAVYPVYYAAVSGFSSGLDFDRSVIAGIRNEAAHIEYTTLDCPDTHMVLGGYSQGAAVTGYVTAAEIPDGVPAELLPELPPPIPPTVADHVAAVVLFGKPSAKFIRRYDAPPVVVGPLYAGKTEEFCARDDTVCNGGDGIPFGHLSYPDNGMTGQAAEFAAARIAADSLPHAILHGWHAPG